MGIPQLGSILQQYPTTVYREWDSRDDDNNVSKSLYIDFSGISYGTLVQVIKERWNHVESNQNGIQQNNDDNDIDDNDDIIAGTSTRTSDITPKLQDVLLAKICTSIDYRLIAHNILCYKVIEYVPEKVLQQLKKIYVANDYKTPIGKRRTQIKRENKQTIYVPIEIRKELADAFYAELQKMKEDKTYVFELVYDSKDTIGEGEWKCLREIWSDRIKKDFTEYYILANDFDIVLGSYLMPVGNSDDKRINVIWKRNKTEICARYISKIINWSTDSPIEKLFIAIYINVYGNDYVPGLIVTTYDFTKVYKFITRIHIRLQCHEQSELYQKIYNVAGYIFTDNEQLENVLSENDWIISLTFIFAYVYCHLITIPFYKEISDAKCIANENVFFDNWNKCMNELKYNDINNDNNDDDDTIIKMTEHTNISNDDMKNQQQKYIITTGLWYIAYCVNAFKRNENDTDTDNFTLTALPMRRQFVYNDERSQINSVVISNKRTVFSNTGTCISRIYSIIKTLFTT